MSNSKNGPLVGLGDKDFDSSLYSQEVDFDFFDESSTTTTATAAVVPSSTTKPINEAETHESQTLTGIGNGNGPPPPATFSTDSLLASLSSLNDVDAASESDHEENDGQRKMSNGHHPRTKLFDISDTSSDEEDDESQPHMIANLNSALLRSGTGHDSIDEDNYLTDDSNVSDITDVTPISSVACSPMPSPCAADVSNDEDDDENGHGHGHGHSPVWIDYERERERDSDAYYGHGQSDPSSHEMHLELNSCGQQLGPLHLDVVDMETPTSASSYLLMETRITPTRNVNTRSHLEMTMTPANCQHYHGLGFSGSQMRNYNNPPSLNIVECNSVSSIPPEIQTSISMSSSSSEIGSGASSMSIPSGAMTSMSNSGSASTTTTHKVFGHTRHSSCKTRCKKDYSFSKDESKRIERDNQILMKKIMETQKRKHHHPSHSHSHAGSTSSSSGHHLKVKQHPAMNARLKQQKRIDYENSILLHKLQNVKPSSEIRVAFPGASSPASRMNGHGHAHSGH